MRRPAALLLALALIACRQHEPAPVPQGQGAERPALALLTGLPLAFGEGFSLGAPSHPALNRLEQTYRVTLVDGPEQVRPGGLLLAAQPRALTAARLVALDRWVREGGRLLLLADPRLTWHTDLPLGDPQRPPFQYADTGLLAHWGLRLDPPVETGPAIRKVGEREILAGSPGTLTADGTACHVEAGGMVARCRLGRGQAVVVADADFLQVGVPGGLDGPIDNNLEVLISELEALSR